MDCLAARSHRFIAVEGGFGSGKSTLGSMLCTEALLMNERCDALIAAPTYKAVRHYMLPPLMEATTRAGLRPRWHATDFVLELRGLRNRRSLFNHHVAIYARSGDAAEDVAGLNVGVIWVDERGRCKRFPHEPLRDLALQLKGRLRDRRAVHAVQIDTGTPEGTATSVYEEYHEHPTDEHIVFRLPTMENAHNLEAGFVPAMEAAYDEEMILQYRDGIPVDIGVGFAYRGYGGHNNGETSYRPDQPLYLALDFNVALLPLLYGQPQGRPPEAPFHVLGEIVDRGGAQTERVVEEFCRRFDPRGGEVAPHRGEVHVFGDATGKRADTRGNLDDWIIVRRALERTFGADAVVWGVQPSNPFVRQRVRRVRAVCRDAAGRVRLVLDPKVCPVLDKDMRSVRWRVGAHTDELDKTDALLTHASDALGYMIYLRYPPPPLVEQRELIYGEMVGGQIDAARDWRQVERGSFEDPFQPASRVTPW